MSQWSHWLLSHYYYHHSMNIPLYPIIPPVIPGWLVIWGDLEMGDPQVTIGFNTVLCSDLVWFGWSGGIPMTLETSISRFTIIYIYICFFSLFSHFKPKVSHMLLISAFPVRIAFLAFRVEINDVSTKPFSKANIEPQQHCGETNARWWAFVAKQFWWRRFEPIQRRFFLIQKRFYLYPSFG